MSMKAKEDKLVARVRELARLPSNKTCFVCGEKGPQYICMNFNTFVCTQCSGLHREFSHRVKGISMSAFTPEEVKALELGGNETARRSYLAKADERDRSIDHTDVKRLREFIKSAFVDKRWHRPIPSGERKADKNEDGVPPPPARKGSSAVPPPVRPVESLLGENLPKLSVNKSSPPPPPASKAAAAPTNLLDFDVPGGPPPPPPPASNNFFDVFGASPAAPGPSPFGAAPAPGPSQQSLNNPFAAPSSHPAGANKDEWNPFEAGEAPSTAPQAPSSPYGGFGGPAAPAPGTVQGGYNALQPMQPSPPQSAPRTPPQSSSNPFGTGLSPQLTGSPGNPFSLSGPPAIQPAQQHLPLGMGLSSSPLIPLSSLPTVEPMKPSPSSQQNNDLFSFAGLPKSPSGPTHGNQPQPPSSQYAGPGHQSMGMTPAGHQPMGMQSMGYPQQQPMGFQQAQQPMGMQGYQQPMGMQQPQQPMGFQQPQQPMGMQVYQQPMGMQPQQMGYGQQGMQGMSMQQQPMGGYGGMQPQPAPAQQPSNDFSFF